MLKKIIDCLLDQPLLASLFITDLGILMLHNPPFIFALLMFCFLIGMSMYFGQKLALFNMESSDS